MENRKVFQDSVSPLPVQRGLTTHGLLVQSMHPEHQQEKMEVLFSFTLPDAARDTIEQKIANAEPISPDELKRLSTPPSSAVDKLKKWLQSQAFSEIQVSQDGSGIYAKAPVSQIEKSLDVSMVRVTKGGLTYTAAQNAPSLPADVGAPVQGIIGLQPFRHAQKHRALRALGDLNRIALGVTDVPVAHRNVANAPPYLVQEIMQAYGADGLDVDGAGQTIAILIDTAPADSDVQQFWARNHIPASNRVEIINVKDTQLPKIEGEETLDVEWASSIASQAKIRVYASSSLSFVDLDKALDRILADAAQDSSLRQVSISLGLGETYFGGPGGEIAAQHQKFLKLAALGVSVFVSSGDAGSNPDDTGHSSTGPLQVEYESSDPYVVAVGGTTLQLDTSGKIASETAWAGSGGGRSKYFKRPSWQKGAGFPASSRRLVPDVSAAADPETGAMVIVHGKVEQIGGTSWSAPVWAGFCALINQARSKAGKPPVFIAPLLYAQAGAACFRDVVEGTNGSFESQSGYDTVTGLGSPNVAELIKALTA